MKVLSVWDRVVPFPFLFNQKPYAILNVYSYEKDYFDTEVLNLMAELSLDLSFALDPYAHETARHVADKKWS